MTTPFGYVGPEQLIRDRSDFARKGIARGRSVVVLTYADGIALRGREPVVGAAQDQRDLRPDRLRGSRQVQRVRKPAGGGRPTRRHARLLYDRQGRHRPRSGQRLRADPRLDLHRAQQAVRGGDRRRRGRRDARRRPDLPAHLRRVGRRRAGLRRDGRPGRADHHQPARAPPAGRHAGRGGAGRAARPGERLRRAADSHRRPAGGGRAGARPAAPGVSPGARRGARAAAGRGRCGGGRGRAEAADSAD